MSNPARLLWISCLLGAIGVIVGAFGAHGLPNYLKGKGQSEEEIRKHLEQCETAVQYHLIHTLAVIALSQVSGFTKRKSLHFATLFMLLGILLFSGGLYSIVFLQQIGHWSIVPLGGSLFILGWLTAAWHFATSRTPLESGQG